MQSQHSEASKILEAGLNKLNFGFFLGERLRVLEEQLLEINKNGGAPSDILILKGRMAEIKDLMALVDQADLEGL